MAMAKQALTSLRSLRNVLSGGGHRCMASGPSKLNPGEVGEVAGIPEKHLHRKVVIFSPARAASQQGMAKTGHWKISFQSNEKWENPLMGWTSTGDPYAAVGEAALTFDTKESAVEFASKHGWDYEVREPHQHVRKPKAYADNFKWKGPPAE